MGRDGEGGGEEEKMKRKQEGSGKGGSAKLQPRASWAGPLWLGDPGAGGHTRGQGQGPQGLWLGLGLRTRGRLLRLQAQGGREGPRVGWRARGSGQRLE